MEKSDISAYAKSDTYYLEKIGDFVRSSRIAQKRTQQELSESAGINRTTLVQMEKGHPVNLLSLIQVLRALKQLSFFQNIDIKPQVSPLKLASIEQKQSLRVRGKNKLTKDKPKTDW